jgi:hypothetical protein
LIKAKFGNVFLNFFCKNTLKKAHFSKIWDLEPVQNNLIPVQDFQDVFKLVHNSFEPVHLQNLIPVHYYLVPITRFSGWSCTCACTSEYDLAPVHRILHLCIGIFAHCAFYYLNRFKHIFQLRFAFKWKMNGGISKKKLGFHFNSVGVFSYKWLLKESSKNSSGR